MSDPMSSNTFIFNDKIDAAYIYEMYDTDYPYIETIFKAILDSIDEDVAAIRESYRKENLGLTQKIGT